MHRTRLIALSSIKALPDLRRRTAQGVHARDTQSLHHGVTSVVIQRVLLTLAVISLPAAHAQAPSAAATAAAQLFTGYDVISVKPSKAGENSWSINENEMTFTATNVALKSLLESAYGIREALISGLPKWAESSRWDIAAKVVEPTAAMKEDHLTREQTQQRDRETFESILRERFQVRVHKEIKVLPTYDLVLSPGPRRLQESHGDGKHGSMNVRNRELTGTQMPMDVLAQFLARQVGRNVLNRTGLTGFYDMALKWSPDELAEAAGSNAAVDRPPAIYQALQEQLGLKLQPSKGPTETLVVDSIQQPMPN